MFCKTCGGLLVPKTTKYGKWMACPKGHTQPELVTESKTGVQSIKKVKKLEIVEDKNHLATHHHICKKCGYDKAELIEMNPMYSDEDYVYRMKCGKCGHTEQLAGKVM